MGIDFDFGKSKNDKEKRNNLQLPAKNEQLEKTSIIQRLFLIGLIGSLVLVSLVGLIAWLVFRKKRQ